MNLEKQPINRKGLKITTALMALGIAILVIGLTGSQLVSAATTFRLNWFNLTPDISPDPDFMENDPTAVEDDTYFSGAADPHLDPYHGLGSSTGGLSGFSSQQFTHVATSTVTMTVLYSDNNYDNTTLEGPELYQPVTNPNPDRRVTGEYSVRVNRDINGQLTPTTIVLSFDKTIFLNEFIVSSLSVVGSSHEHAIVRAFATEDATGPVVKASGFINISNLADCAGLLLSAPPPLCDPAGPVTNNALTNVTVDPDLIDAGNDGTYDNVGSAADDGVYHVYGVGEQSADAYGRIKFVYEDTPIRSIAVSIFATSTLNPDPFTDTTYETTYISTSLAPVGFTPEDTTAITLRQESATTQNTGLILIGLALIVMATISGLAFRQRGKVQ